jgi:DNA relaxase NicK
MGPLYADIAPLTLLPIGRGLYGYQQASQIIMAGVPLGRMDYGGESQRGWVRVDVPAKGCEWIKDWDLLSSVEQLPSAQLRRLDIALTTWEGQMTHDKVVEAHQRGRFITGGRPPHIRQITSSDPRAGQTCYIGNRKADKFLRAYEKGFEMAAKFPTIQIAKIDGFDVEDIYRVELELKADTTDIPWDVVARRDQYFAGAYPFCADVLPGIEADILQRRPEREPQLDLLAALANCKRQFGNTLFTALSAHGGDIGAVWDQVIGKEHNQSLVEAGVLLVEH